MKEVVVTSGVLKQVLRLACERLGEGLGKSLGVEVSGLLTGHAGKKEILINDVIIGDQISTPFYTSLTDDSLARIAKEISNGQIRGRIYGWFHSHAGLGLFLSSIDLKTLRNMQRLCPDAVALVVDPLAEERFRFFRYDFNLGRPRSLQVRVIGYGS